ncbi:MAG: outer membrane beta-barrel family protein [Muribaculaceae bacterium]|jgi:hypothetical protein|nr:outer membrane beta-barrel family protein [Muribaculaceae bacterium]
MKKRFTAILMCLFVGIFTVFAQQSAICTIKGELLDSASQKGEAFATVKISKADSAHATVKVIAADENGRFSIEIPDVKGKYVASLTSVGKEPIVKNFSITSDSRTVNLGKLFTHDVAVALKGVEVTAQKPLVTMDVDKLSYDIAADPDSKTNTVMEMLRKVPMVTVDGQDNIKVNGKSSFKIYVNGKPNTLMSNNPKDVLKSMPANSIKKIEVITSPGAKYDAEGTTGILNIVTEQGSGIEGYSATISGNVGNRNAGGSVYAITKKGKLTLSANYDFSHSMPMDYNSMSERENLTSDTQKYLDNTGKANYYGNFQYATLEGSYEIDTLQLLTTSFTLWQNNYHINSDGSTAMWNSARDQLAYGYDLSNHSASESKYIQGSLDYQLTSPTCKDRTYTFSYKLNSGPDKSHPHQLYSNIQDNLGLDIVKNMLLNNSYGDNSTNTAEHTFQFDFTTPIGKLHTIETGAKYILRNNNSNNKVFEATGATDDYVYNNNRSSHYRNINDIFAAYLTYQLKYKKFTFKPGLRYEYTYQKIKYLGGAISSDANFSTHYDNLVPSVATGFTIGNTRSIRLEYSMRISRPGISYLNPFFNNLDPTSISQGNTNVGSEKGNSFSISYSSFTQKYNFSVWAHHNFSNNGIESVSRLIGDGGEWFDGNLHFAPAGALYTTYANIGHSRSSGLGIYGSWTPIKDLQFFINGNANYVYMSDPARSLKNYGWSGMAFVGGNYKFPFKLRIGLYAGGGTRDIMLQGKGTSWNYWSMSLSQDLLKDDRLTLSASCSNPFRTTTFRNSSNGTNYTSWDLTRVSQSNFQFTVSYRIGSLKASVKKASVSISNDDVKSGGGSGGQGGAPQQGGGGH